MNTCIVFPPQWEPGQPYLALPALVGFLRENGIRVAARDASVESYDRFISRAGMERLRPRLERRAAELENAATLTENDVQFHQRLNVALLMLDYVRDNIDDAVAIQRTLDRFLDFDQFEWSARLISTAFMLVSSAHSPAELSLSDFMTTYNFSSSRQVFQALDDENQNIYLPYLKEELLPWIRENDPTVLGISVSAPQQIIPGFALAKLVKQERPDLHITVGGGVFSKLTDELQENKVLWELVDSFVIHEGETAYLRLLEQIDSGGSLKKVPNLIHREGDKVIVNEPFHSEDINALPAPDFSDMPLDLYFSPEPIFPLLTSRNCYFKKCTFCTSWNIYAGGFKQRTPEKVVTDMEVLGQKHDARYFLFSDQAFSLPAMRGISREILDRNLDVYWMTEMRFEKNLSRDTLSLAAQSGCRKLFFGLESGNQRVLDVTKKGTRLEVSTRIMNDCTDLGISTHLFCIVGYPTETPAEAHETVDYILSHPETVQFPGFSFYLHDFGLERVSAIAHDPPSFGIARIIDEPDEDIGLHYNYEVSIGMSAEEAAVLRVELMDRARLGSPLRYPQSGAHSLIYRAHYGNEFPPEPVPEPAPVLDDQAFFDLKLRLAEWVNLTTFKNLAAVRPALVAGAVGDGPKAYAEGPQPHELSLIFSGSRGETRFLQERGRALLEMCNGTLTVREICSAYAAERENVADSAVALKDLTQFFREGFITAD